MSTNQCQRYRWRCYWAALSIHYSEVKCLFKMEINHFKKALSLYNPYTSMKYIYLQFYSAETERSRYVIYATIYKKTRWIKRWTFLSHQRNQLRLISTLLSTFDSSFYNLHNSIHTSHVPMFTLVSLQFQIEDQPFQITNPLHSY